jgi:hypothetical protein
MWLAANCASSLRASVLRFGLTVSATAILLFPLSAGAAHRPAVTTPPGSIAGTVSSSGSPVANATVNVWRDGKQVSSVAVTGDRFTFSGPEGTYEVQASAPGYKPAVTVRITVVVHAERETWVNLVLVPAP